MPKTTSPRALLFAGALALSAPAAQAADWLLASSSPRVVPGQRFEVVVIGEGRAAEWPARLPASIELPGGGPSIAVELVAIGKAAAGAGQRRYFARWPMEVAGVAALALVGRPSAHQLPRYVNTMPPVISKTATADAPWAYHDPAGFHSLQ